MITGANGFIGSKLSSTLVSHGMDLIPTVRGKATAGEVSSGTIGPKTDWYKALSKGPEVVIHLAARVHLTNREDSCGLNEYRLVNVEGSINLARQCVASGVKRFIFLSSVKVHGSSSLLGQSFQADDIPDPTDSYAVSKYEAEQELGALAAATGMELVIIRPPIVYGPGVKANFKSMIRLLMSGLPLPLAAVTNNRRSIVALDNLVDLIVTCIDHSAAANQIFLVSDGEDVSTVELLQRMAVALERSARFFYVPRVILKSASYLIGRPDIYQRLCQSLQVDMSKTQQLLNWNPPLTVDEGLRNTARGYRV
jgi:nucleoside-diphosphate-sugar epimerase